MPLIACPDCNKPDVSDRAAACPNCGAPMNLPVPVREATPVRVTAPVVVVAAPSVLDCPRCGSGDVRTFPVIWEDGTSRMSVGSAGYVAGGIAVARTGGTSQTLASTSAAPPEEKSNSLVVTFLVIGLLVAFGSFSGGNIALGVVGVFVAIVTGLIARENDQYNSNVFPALVQQWERTYRCNRCGNVFEAQV
jgi:DNA-directed RNA polymerase subunit RPC12/RpoP